VDSPEVQTSLVVSIKQLQFGVINCLPVVAAYGPVSFVLTHLVILLR